MGISGRVAGYFFVCPRFSYCYVQQWVYMSPFSLRLYGARLRMLNARVKSPLSTFSAFLCYVGWCVRIPRSLVFLGGVGGSVSV